LRYRRYNQTSTSATIAAGATKGQHQDAIMTISFSGSITGCVSLGSFESLQHHRRHVIGRRSASSATSLSSVIHLQRHCGLVGGSIVTLASRCRNVSSC
jgi:hypothetical protein